MYTVYVLYSNSCQKTYVGFTTDLHRRLIEHNITEIKGFTLRFRPWSLIHIETYETKKEAMDRERFLKSGQGREMVKGIVSKYLSLNPF